MGFCRRCGEIVLGPRCRCGGSPVDAVVSWNNQSRDQAPDRWSKTYISRDKSPTRNPDRESSQSTPTITGQKSRLPGKRFPHPLPTAAVRPVSMHPHVSAHIASTTSSTGRPSSSLKTHLTEPLPESEILPSLDTPSLSKVYGSVLQPKETLKTYSCAICAVRFLPDTTIYPDPNAPSNDSRFLCRQCFTDHGGSKGPCVSCARPVLTTVNEGGFVSAAGQVWHTRCFRCDGCFKDISNQPMVDLFGKPSCVECFDSCLKRDRNPSNARRGRPRGGESTNLGGLHRQKSRGGSPALEELEQRLGVAKSSESGRPSTVSFQSVKSELDSANRNSAVDHKSGCSPQYRRLNAHDVSSREMIGQDSSLQICELPTKATPRSPGELAKGNLQGSPSVPNSRSALVPSSSDLRELKDRAHSSPSPDPPASYQDNSFGSIHSLVSGPPFSSNASGVRNSCGQRFRASAAVPSHLMAGLSDTTQCPAPHSPLDNSVHTDSFGAGGGSDTATDGCSQPRYSKVHLRAEHGDSRDADARLPVPNGVVAAPGPAFLKATLTSSISRPSHRPTSVVSPDATCTRCRKGIFSVGANFAGGHFVTVPRDQFNDTEDEYQVYHPECFTCIVCDDAFRDGGTGKAVFVRSEGGPCHIDCVPSAQKSIAKVPKTSSLTMGSYPLPRLLTDTATNVQASKQIEPRRIAATTNTPISPLRFGSKTICPGCHESVSPMEQGVIPGPQDTRWHRGCLVCGGKNMNSTGRKRGTPGCGKNLDSSAKGDGEGGVWCCECLLLLPARTRNTRISHQITVGSPRVVPTYAGTASSNVLPKITRQLTGAATSTCPSTGLRGGTALAGSLMRREGQLSPTKHIGTDRSISPTRGVFGRYSPIKQVGIMREGPELGVGVRDKLKPRPKSAIGIRLEPRRGDALG